MIFDVNLFYFVAIPAVILYGVAKGGFAGPIAVVGVPLMSIVVSPLQAAAIMLPILCLQDVIAVLSYRRKFHYKNLQTLLPGALLGIIAGTLWFRYLSDDLIRIFIGVISIAFVLNYVIIKESIRPLKVSYLRGTLFGSLSGFISFGIHAGGIPFNMYMYPQKLDQKVLAGTAAIFFAIVNYIKVIPYFLLGQLNFENLITSLILMPFAPLGFLIGYYLTHRVNERLFYSVAYLCLFFVGLKLLYEGIVNIL